MGNGHSHLAPSAAERWANCPASVPLCAGQKERTSPHALEGSIAHALAAKCLEQYLDPASVPQVTLDDGAEHEIPESMVEPVSYYVSTVRVMTEGAEWVKIECRVALDEVYSVDGQSGTADVLALVGDTLQVHDFKYGRGVRVTAVENKQLRIYGAGAYFANQDKNRINRIQCFIHQPRITRDVSEETMPVADLLAFCEELRGKALAAHRLFQNPNHINDACFRPTEKGCRWCLYAAECKALREYVGKVIADDFDNLTEENVVNRAEEVKKLDGEESVTQQFLGESLKAIPLIQTWIKAIEQKAHDVMLGGGNVDGYKLVLGRGGRRQWVDDSEAERVLKSMRLKKDQMYDLKVISPTQASKLLKSSKRKLSRLETLITRADPKPTIAPIDDPRPAHVIEPPEDDFDDLTEETNEDFADLIGGE